MADAEHKKAVITYLEQQWEQTPKDQNRAQFLTQTNDMIARLKGQNAEIKTNLDEIKTIHVQTATEVQRIRKVDADLEEIVFKDAQKDKIAKDIYKEIQQLKGDYDKLITSVQEKTTVQTTIREVRNKIDDFRIKYKNLSEINKLKDELSAVQLENSSYQQLIAQYAGYNDTAPLDQAFDYSQAN